jgi:hypothetical protein
LSVYLEKPLSDLLAIKESPELKTLDRMVIEVVAKAVEYGDQTRLNFLLDRLIGKVDNPTQEFNFSFATFSREQVIELGKEAIKYLEAKKHD